MITDWSLYPNFSKAEFDCKETGENDMRQEFMQALQALRTAYGAPMVITSGYRSARHSIEARKDKPGAHESGMACDVSVGPGARTYDLVRLAILHGFTGIGVSQKNGLPRFIHLDMLPRKAVWSY